MQTRENTLGLREKERECRPVSSRIIRKLTQSAYYSGLFTLTSVRKLVQHLIYTQIVTLMILIAK